MLSAKDRDFLKATAERQAKYKNVDSRVINEGISAENQARLDSLVERGYIRLENAVCVGRLTGEKIVTITEAGLAAIGFESIGWMVFCGDGACHGPENFVPIDEAGSTECAKEVCERDAKHINSNPPSCGAGHYAAEVFVRTRE